MRSLTIGLIFGASMIALVACSDDANTSSSSSSSSSGSSGSGATCLDPATFDYVVPLRNEDSEKFLTYQASADASLVFISTLSGVYTVDPATKAFNPLYAPANAIVPHHYLRANDVIVNSALHLWSVPKAGGAPTALPDFKKLPLGTLAGTEEITIDGDTLYALDNAGAGTVYKHDLMTGAETDLGTEVRARNSSIYLGPDAIYSYYPNDDSSNAPTTLWKLSKSGGAVTPITITGAPSQTNYPLGVTGNDLFVLSFDTTNFKAHVLRVPTSGGAAVDVGSTQYAITLRGQSFSVPAQGGTVIRIVNELFWVPDGAATMTSLGCFPDTHSPLGVTAIGKKAFVGIATDTQGGMIALPIP